MKCILLLTTMSLGTLMVNAQMSTDRPNASVGASLVEPGRIQTEIGYQSLIEGTAQEYVQQQFPNALFRIGMLDGLELRLAANYIKEEKDTALYMGMSSFEIGSKIRLLQRSRHLLTYYLEVFTPTGSEGVSDRLWGLDTRLTYETSAGAYGGINANIGFNKKEHQQNIDLTWTLAYAYSFSKRTSFYIEPYGVYQDLDEWNFYADAGLLILASRRLQLDIYMGTGLNNKQAFIGVGFSTISRKSDRSRQE